MTRTSRHPVTAMLRKLSPVRVTKVDDPGCTRDYYVTLLGRIVWHLSQEYDTSPDPDGLADALAHAADCAGKRADLT